MTIQTRARILDPSNSREWLLAARHRLSDAKILADIGSAPVASIYLAGYAIECALKAHLDNSGEPRPRRGGEGHNLRALWSACELVLRDLDDADGTKSYFMTDWSTDLRYQIIPNTALHPQDLVKSAGFLLTRISNFIRRNAGRRRYR